VIGAVLVIAAVIGVRIPAAVVAIWLLAIPVSAAVVVTPRTERLPVVALLTAAMAIRLSIGAIVLTFFHAQLFDVFKDTARYETIGAQVADAWDHGVSLDLYQTLAISTPGYYYVVAALDRVAGHNEMLVVAFNAGAAAVCALLVHQLALRTGLDRTMRITAAAIAAFAPSVVFWGSVPLKDALVSALIVAAVLSALALSGGRSGVALITISVTSLALSTLRIYATLFVTLAVLVVIIGRALWRSRPLWSLAVLAFVVLLQIYALVGPAGLQLVTSIGDPAELARLRELYSGGTSGVDEGESLLPGPGSGIGGYVSLLLRAPYFVALFALLPIPGVTSGRLVPLAVPEMPLWYEGCVAACYGLVLLWRRDHTASFVIGVTVLAMAFLEGAVVSNAGTMIRERAPAIELLAVPMALAVVGLVRRARARP